MRALPEVIDICKNGLKLYPNNQDLKDIFLICMRGYSQEKERMMPQIRAAGMSFEEYAWSMCAIRSYPWAPKELMTRSKDSICEANKGLEIVSTCLEIRPSPLAAGCSGMFAKTNIKKGEKILDSPCATGVSASQETGQYCYNCAAKLKASKTQTFDCCPKIKFCSAECKDIAGSNYHQAICGKDFDYIYKDYLGAKTTRASSTARVSAVFLRLMAMCVQAGRSPFDHPLIASLTANYESEAPSPWSFASNIVGPIRVLQTLGVDVFVEDFDTWVLQTVWYGVYSHLLQIKFTEYWTGIGQPTTLGPTPHFGNLLYILYFPFLIIAASRVLYQIRNYL